MRIECPGCAARYEVPEARLAPGRSVRCARCGNDWVPLPPEAGEAARPTLPVEPSPPVAPPLADEGVDDGRTDDEASDAPAVAPPRRPHPFTVAPRTADPALDVMPTANAPKRRVTPLAAAWALSVAAVVMLVVLAVVLHRPISRAWPPSLRVYDALNLSTADAP